MGHHAIFIKVLQALLFFGEEEKKVKQTFLRIKIYFFSRTPVVSLVCALLVALSIVLLQPLKMFFC
ncbi:hypothetical protein M2306_002501 [Myroides gitamensis]|jgi:hypothetical protein|nr:hypothetical protein [Myroides odoratus]MDH6601807.1 hypothetical protein [Myroides gitamensis]STZ30306.1 Uncharacterised protein [Myroides odoratus]